MKPTLRGCLVSWEYVWLHLGGDNGDISQLQKYFGLNPLMYCDCGGKSSFPVPLPGKKKQTKTQTLIRCIYDLSHMYVLCADTNIFIPAQKAQLIALWFPSQLTLAPRSSSVTAPPVVVFQLRTFLHIPLPLHGFKGQVVLPPVAFVPMTLSQTFALAISILLPLIAHWTCSWVNALVLSRLEKISFPLSKLNKNKEIKLNTKLCLNNSWAVTWGRKLRDKADDLPRSAAGMKARMSATIQHFCGVPSVLHQSSECLEWENSISGLGWEGGDVECPPVLFTPQSAGWELVPQCTQVLWEQRRGATGRRCEGPSDPCPHAVHPPWTEEIISMEQLRLLLG